MIMSDGSGWRQLVMRDFSFFLTNTAKLVDNLLDDINDAINDGHMSEVQLNKIVRDAKALNKFSRELSGVGVLPYCIQYLELDRNEVCDQQAHRLYRLALNELQQFKEGFDQ